jgi:hypothetical protein
MDSFGLNSHIMAQLRLAELAKIMKHVKRQYNAVSIEAIAACNILPQILH